MAGFFVKKVTVSGSGKHDSSVTLTHGLNVITGPSNTGKTCIVKCIDFVFGSDSKKPPFSAKHGFTTVTVDVETSNGQVTFERKIDGKKINVISDNPDIEDGEYNPRQGNKIISPVWLQMIGINEEHSIISGEDFQTQRLTWRTFLHALMVDEHEIDREQSILLQKYGKTAFYSSLLFLFYNKDFSEYAEQESKHDKDIRHTAVSKYINKKLQLLAERQLSITGNLDDFQDIDVDKRIEELVSSLSEIEESLTRAMNQSKTLIEEMLQKKGRLAECDIYYSRHQSLKSQYVASVKRLTFIVESEGIMQDMPHTSTCPFCENNLPSKVQKSYKQAATAELARIISQLDGLNESEQNITQERASLNDSIETLEKEKTDIESLIHTELQPKATELRESIKAYRIYIQLQNELNIIDSVSKNWSDDLVNLENEEDSKIKYKPKTHFDSEFWKLMDTYLKEILTECKFSPLVSAHLSFDDFDIEVNGEKKSVDYGKGYCAFLNAVLVLAFRKYMAEKSMYNPGFCVIDTPLLGLDDGSQSETPESIKNALFQYFIDHQEEGQLIIIENSSTMPKLDYTTQGTTFIEFTRGLKSGRYGFLDGVY